MLNYRSSEEDRVNISPGVIFLNIAFKFEILCYFCGPYNGGPVVQLVRMPACHAGGRGFESRPVRSKR